MAERKPLQKLTSKPVVSDIEKVSKPPITAIVAEPKVLRRVERKKTLDKITSNGTIAAAVMVVAAIIAVIVANTDAFEIVREVIEAEIGIAVGPFEASISIEAFVNDFLMAIFFLLVGIELKYEVTVGQLKNPRQALLPILAACGGVAAPAIIYVIFNHGGILRGWATPIATDIAFALGVMSLLGNKVAPDTKVFFQTLAVADDILAIVVIALFYGQTPNLVWCLASLVVVLVLAFLNWIGVYSARPYILVGLVLWFCMFNSGIHATLAGVILGFFLPSRSDLRLGSLRDWLGAKAIELEDDYDDESHVLGQHDFTHAAVEVEKAMHRVTPPLQRVEHRISTFVNFFILPVFAFVNAQVRIVGADPMAILGDHVAQGVYCGAVFGKPIGIILVTFIVVKIGLSALPPKVDWKQIIAVGIMGGLGFTMSILISGLAFSSPEEIIAAKCAILAGSVTAAVVGLLFVAIFCKKAPDAPVAEAALPDGAAAEGDAAGPKSRRVRKQQPGGPAQEA